MSGGLVHTVMRRSRHGVWLAIRMCDDQEMYRASGMTYDQAKARLREKGIPDIVTEAFKQRGNPIVDNSSSQDK